MKPSGMPVFRYLRMGLGRRLSIVGEKLGIHWLVYNPLHFRHFHDHAMANAPGVVETLLQVFPDAETMADVGAGSGAFAAEAQRLGRRVVAYEHSRTGRNLALKQGVDCRAFDLNHDPPVSLGSGFDLAWCLEVAEHLPPALGDKLVSLLAALAPTVVFTAARPGQGGTGHINEQPKGYWINRFAAVSLQYSESLSTALRDGFVLTGVPAQYLIKNVMVFVKSPNQVST